MKKFLLILVLLLAVVVLLACLAFLGYYAYRQCWFNHDYNDKGVCTRCGRHDVPNNKPEENTGTLLLDTESIVITDFDESAEHHTQRINAMLNGTANDSTVAWMSDNVDVATVDDFGLVTIRGCGKATITATCAELTATCSVTVSAKLQGIALSPAELQLDVGSSQALGVKPVPAYAEIDTAACVFSISDESIATVDADGVVTAVAAGETTLVCEYDDYTATTQIRVIIPVEKITLNIKGIDIESKYEENTIAYVCCGKTYELTAEVYPQNATYAEDVKNNTAWNSSNELACKITQRDNDSALFSLQVLHSGTGEISVTAGGVTAKQEFAVLAPQEVTFEDITVDVGSKVQLKTIGTEDIFKPLSKPVSLWDYGASSAQMFVLSCNKEGFNTEPTGFNSLYNIWVDAAGTYEVTVTIHNPLNVSEVLMTKTFTVTAQ
ncbi:MAG: Ig-like domain-containing protein [Corallococcus sp.]|nr:Ig-like domain-containing protein [Corallococcus sp.]MCM1359098.1 Ig-like domain-containing protein [Corallococcus sp.]MCM1395087.1 Ig-like domain-containing protein [Corallococcus sp.]